MRNGTYDFTPPARSKKNRQFHLKSWTGHEQDLELEEKRAQEACSHHIQSILAASPCAMAGALVVAGASLFFWGAIVLIKFWTTTACKFMHAIRLQAWRNPMSHTASLHVDHFHADKACAFSTHIKEIMPAGLCHIACHALIAPLP